MPDVLGQGRNTTDACSLVLPFHYRRLESESSKLTAATFLNWFIQRHPGRVHRKDIVGGFIEKGNNLELEVAMMTS